MGVVKSWRLIVASLGQTLACSRTSPVSEPPVLYGDSQDIDLQTEWSALA